MAGRNLFYERLEAKSAGVREDGKPCVFVAHRKKDIDKAVETGEVLKKAGINIYLDEEDKEMQAADRARDHEAVVKYIEAGLGRSTHFLGVITDNTVGSWWVPFEFGMAKRAGKICAHLIDKKVEELPSFVLVSRILSDKSLILEWIKELRSVKVKAASSFNALVEVLLEDSHEPDVSMLPFIAESRPVSALKFVE